MKMCELMKLDVTLDIGNDYADTWTDCSGNEIDALIAFCGPQKITEEGEKEWKDVLDMDIIIVDNKCADIHIPGETDEEKEKNINRAYSFLYSVAGYCPVSLSRKWFADPI